jgi:HdeA/HdeB family protein
MMKFVKLAGVVVIAGLLSVGTADAQQVELSKLRCREFIDLPKETIANITLWLDGYYTDEEDPAVVDFDKVKAKADRLVAFCAQNPKSRVMTAAEDAILK